MFNLSHWKPEDESHTTEQSVVSKTFHRKPLQSGAFGETTTVPFPDPSGEFVFDIVYRVHLPELETQTMPEKTDADMRWVSHIGNQLIDDVTFDGHG